MNEYEAFRILEIEYTDDKKKIKKAYASLVKKYHPEEHPVEWKRVRDAYETALNFAENIDGQAFREDDIGAWSGDILNKETEWNGIKEVQDEEEEHQKTESKELDEIFDNLDEVSSDSKKMQEAEHRKQMSDAINALYVIRSKKNTGMKDWQFIFNNENFYWAVRQDEFITEWGRTLENKVINKKLYEYLKNQLQVVKKYRWEIQGTANKTGIISSVAFTDMKIESAYRNPLVKKRGILKKVFLFCLGLMLVILVFENLGKEKNDQPSREALREQQEQLLEIQKEHQEEQMTNLGEMLLTDGSRESYQMLLMGIQTMDEEYQQSKLENNLQLREGIYLNKLGSEFGKDEEYYFHEIPPEKIGTVDGIALSDLNSYAFEITASKEGKTLVLCCDLTVLPLDGECSVYYDAGEGYELVRKWDGQSLTQSTEERYWFQMLDYRVFVIEISVKEDEETHAVVFVVNGEQEKVGKWEEEILSDAP